MEIRTRFAPSPTGDLHIGGARTALFNYLFAKSMKGKFLLRIEDTDLKRSKSSLTEKIINDIKWLNIPWDEEIVFQRKNQNKHKQIIDYLLKKGLAFRCFAERENQTGSIFEKKVHKRLRSDHHGEILVKIHNLINNMWYDSKFQVNPLELISLIK